MADAQAGIAQISPARTIQCFHGSRQCNHGTGPPLCGHGVSLTKNQEMKNKISDILENRIMVLDGAMGTMLQQHGLGENDFRGELFKRHDTPLKGCNDVLNLTREGLIAEIHRSYLAAGADIIETNTFSSAPLSLASYGLSDHAYEINKRGAMIAKKCADEYSSYGKLRFVAGSMGPGSKSLSVPSQVDKPSGRQVNFDDLANAYSVQAEALLDGGCDLLLIETVFDTLNAKACLFAISNVFERNGREVPVMISVSINDSSGRTLSGQTLDAFLVSVGHFPFLSVGINCALGASEIKPFLSQLSEKTPCFVSVHPNAGLPNEEGGYDETPEQMAGVIKEYIHERTANIIGGCCGTTPEHTRLICGLVNGVTPRKPPKADRLTRLSGLDTLSVSRESNFINIGERTNVAGSARFARLIREKDYDAAISVARQQVENGAQIIDINLDDGLLDPVAEMENFTRLLGAEPDIARVPFMPDSSRWDVIETALKNIQGKPVVNSISLKEGEDEFLCKARLIKKSGAAVVVMAFDEKGQATDYGSRIRICERAYVLLTEKAGLPPQDIVFDCNILAIGTGIEDHSGFAAGFIEAVKWIKKNLPHAKTSGGISNLSFAFRGNNRIREALHSVFLYHAVNAGLDMGIVNAGTLPVYDDIEEEFRKRCEDLILDKRKDATERLMAFARIEGIKQTPDGGDIEKQNILPAPERLEEALVRGIADHLEEDIKETLKETPVAIDIIEGPLMRGINRVGGLFSQGKMFLPQVIKSARVMKKAVSILQPLLESQKTAAGRVSDSGTVLLATVKGDIHDIGKNIASLVLSCNSFRIIDLGIMVSRERIVSEAVRQKADIVGLSGLITPSLEEMAGVAAEMEKQGLKVPLLIGGATTSKVHTALKIDPLYSGPVIHVKDASKAVQISAELIRGDGRKRIQSEYKSLYKAIRKDYREKRRSTKPLALEDARKRRFIWEEHSARLKEPSFTGIREIRPDIRTLREYIDWNAFFRQWKVKAADGEATTLREDALELLRIIESSELLEPKGVFGFFRANSENEDVIVKLPDGSHEKIHFLRDCSNKPEGENNLCLSDFIAPGSFGVTDHIGLFALSAGFGAGDAEKEWLSNNDDYSAILLRTIADRLAEAFAEYLHVEVRKKFWAYDPGDRGIRPAPGYPACPDHSEKQTIFNLLEARERTGMQLTENHAMIPAASVCGYYFAHPGSRYFSIGDIGREQLVKYAASKNMEVAEIKKLLSYTLNRKR